jgi:isopentenyl-diphosphate delta-isomerase
VIEMPIIEKRKGEHIDICLREDVQFKEKRTGFEDVSFKEVELDYKTMPQIDKESVCIETEFLGKKFSAPLMVQGMVGGIKRAEKINKEIAIAVESLGLGMGVGSQRPMLENHDSWKSFFVRDVAPNIFLAGNIGVVQLKEFSIKQIEAALEKIKADALAIHTNAGQEAAQPEGTTNFSNCLEEIARVADELSKPVYVKEVGHGINKEIAKELNKTKIAALDVAGAGGTSWIKIEAKRHKEGVSKTFEEVGIPTVVSLIEARKVFKKKIIASGGIRNGLDVVKAIVLGADLAGIAWPVIKAQSINGSEGVKKYLMQRIEEIRVAMFLLGSKNIKELKKQKFVVLGKTREWLEQLKD